MEDGPIEFMMCMRTINGLKKPGWGVPVALRSKQACAQSVYVFRRSHAMRVLGVRAMPRVLHGGNVLSWWHREAHRRSDVGVGGTSST